jgi:hypothetical protein
MIPAVLLSHAWAPFAPLAGRRKVATGRAQQRRSRCAAPPVEREFTNIPNRPGGAAEGPGARPPPPLRQAYVSSRHVFHGFVVMSVAAPTHPDANGVPRVRTPTAPPVLGRQRRPTPPALGWFAQANLPRVNYKTGQLRRSWRRPTDPPIAPPAKDVRLRDQRPAAPSARAGQTFPSARARPDRSASACSSGNRSIKI